MSRTWVTADLHLGHRNILNFTDNEGNKIRPGFTDEHHMNNVLRNNWNELVNPEDRVYILGDLVINRRSIPLIGGFNGRKVLVKGNHDLFKLKDYLPYFDDIRSCVTSPHQYIMSHIPIHPSSLARWQINIHGHLHKNVVRLENGKPDCRYHCVSVENTNFKPVLLDSILKEYKIGK